MASDDSIAAGAKRLPRFTGHLPAAICACRPHAARECPLPKTPGRGGWMACHLFRYPSRARTLAPGARTSTRIDRHSPTPSASRTSGRIADEVLRPQLARDSPCRRRERRSDLAPETTGRRSGPPAPRNSVDRARPTAIGYTITSARRACSRTAAASGAAVPVVAVGQQHERPAAGARLDTLDCRDHRVVQSGRAPRVQRSTAATCCGVDRLTTAPPSRSSPLIATTIAWSEGRSSPSSVRAPSLATARRSPAMLQLPIQTRPRRTTESRPPTNVLMACGLAVLDGR